MSDKEKTHERCASCLCSLVLIGTALYADSFGPLCKDCHSRTQRKPCRYMLSCIGGPLDGLSVSCISSSDTGGFTVKGGYYLIQDLAHIGQRFVYMKDRQL